MGARRADVVRPVRTTEFTIVFGTRAAELGWRDLVATQRNAVVAAWERLTTDPTSEDLTCHALRGELGVVTHSGRDWVRRQYELNAAHASGSRSTTTAGRCTSSPCTPTTRTQRSEGGRVRVDEHLGVAAAPLR